MKCHVTLKALYKSLLICLFLGGVASSEVRAEAIESTFYKAELMLRRSPAHLNTFKAFKETVFRQLRSFLDVNNTEKYEVHVGYIERTVQEFHASFVAQNTCIQKIAAALHADLAALLELLKGHVSTRSSISLGLALMRFEHLLPKLILKEVGGAFRLQSLLEHRMKC